MLALFRNPLLRLLGRLWWLPALTLAAAWGLGGERGLRVAGMGVAAYLAAVVGMIGAAWARGAYAALRERVRRRSLTHRFLCPICLQFGSFHFACVACEKKVEAFLVHTNGAYVNNCPHCRAQLLEWGEVQAYCEQCQEYCDRTIHHQRQVRVLATLLPADFTSLRQITGAQERLAQHEISYACDDDDVRLTYLLKLNSLTHRSHSLPRTHALWELKSIWLDAAGDDTEAALKVGEAADRFDRQTGLAKTLTVCVPQIKLGNAVKNVLETRFGVVEYGVAAADFLGRKVKALTAPKTIQAEVEPAGTMTGEKIEASVRRSIE